MYKASVSLLYYMHLIIMLITCYSTILIVLFCHQRSDSTKYSVICPAILSGSMVVGIFKYKNISNL